jgi:SAM-dependent methyltransferase
VTAADRWASELEAWAIPQRLLDAVPDSPYDWPVELWRRSQRDRGSEGTVTQQVVFDLLGDDGTLLDVGAGTGRASLSAAVAGHPLTAVEPSPEMAAGLKSEAERLGVALEVVEDAWPDAAAAVVCHDVALSANVVYGVSRIAPFLEALNARARRGVVVELSPRHPWCGLAPYFRALHDLERPEGPGVEMFVEVVAETLGRTPHVEVWSRPGVMRFADLQELLDLYRRRLVLPVERTGELADLLAPEIREEGGWLTVGEPERPSCTVWWGTG